jgi:hypothetical protein
VSTEPGQLQNDGFWLLTWGGEGRGNAIRIERLANDLASKTVYWSNARSVGELLPVLRWMTSRQGRVAPRIVPAVWSSSAVFVLSVVTRSVVLSACHGSFGC